MCDIYTGKCSVCSEEIEMHLADYNTAPNEIEIFCQGCFPENRYGGTVWKYRDSKNAKWKKMLVMPLTENALENSSGNHPNSSFIEVEGIPDGTLEVIDEAVQMPKRDN